MTLNDIDPAELAKMKGDSGQQDPCEPLPECWQDMPEEWLTRHNRFGARSRQGGVRVLFIGDSITEGWSSPDNADPWNRHFADLPSANYGIGGDRTQQLLWRIDHGTLDGINPEVVVLLIGVNNLWAMHHTPDAVTEGIKAVVARIKRKVPQAKILLQGILPTGELPNNPLRTIIIEINQNLMKLDNGEDLRFYDFGPMFLEPDGKILPSTMPDFCHLTSESYVKWADALAGPINELMAKP